MEAVPIRGRGGNDNYVPHLTRLLSSLRKTLPEMDECQLAALMADLGQLKAIIDPAVSRLHGQELRRGGCNADGSSRMNDR